MEPVIGLAALFVFGGLFTYTISERRHRHRWERFERRPIEQRRRDADDPFRRDLGPTPLGDALVLQRSPRLIRHTALWSIYMGQMALPGGLLGLIGTVFGGIGLISIPGMILAVRIWRLGYAMLRRDPGAELEARKLARFAVVLNLVAVVIGLGLLAIGGEELAVVSMVLFAYGVVSFAHAQAMRRCADRLGEDRLRREQYECEQALAGSYAGWQARTTDVTVST